MIYGDRLDDHGRKFIGLHETVLLCALLQGEFFSSFVARLPEYPNNLLSLELLPRLMAGQTEGSQV